MDNKIYYIMNLYNYIQDKIIHYNRKIVNCITLIKLIEENYEKTSCKYKILKYINRLFQNNYKLKDTNSIKICYEGKELYYYYRNEGKNDTFINNIKLDIIECFKSVNKSKNGNKDIKGRKIKNSYKNRRIKKNYIKCNINKDFTKYIERIDTIKRNLYKGYNDKNFYYCFIDNRTKNNDEIISNMDFEIEININENLNESSFAN